MGFHNVHVAGHKQVACQECGRVFDANAAEGRTACPRCGHVNHESDKKRRIGRLKAKYS